MTKFEKVFNESFEEILKTQLETQYLVVDVQKNEMYIKLNDIDFGLSITLPKQVDEKFLEDKCQLYLNYVINGITNCDEIKAKYDMHFRRLSAKIYTVLDNIYFEYKGLKKTELESYIKDD